MLQSIHIKNFAIIEDLEINFQDGFNIITGETGAGKSIILGALGLILGQRADLNTPKNKDKKCSVEAAFDVSRLSVQALFQAHDLDFEAMTIVRREILPGGRSRAFVNDTPASLNVLKELGNQIIDVHAQHENLAFKNKDFVYDLLDANNDLLVEYSASYVQLKDLQVQIENIESKLNTFKEDQDYLNFQLNELVELNFQKDEFEALEDELNALSNAEEIQMLTSEIEARFMDDSQGVISGLNQIAHRLGKLSVLVSKLGELNTRFNSAHIELKDLAHELVQVADQIEINPVRLEFIHERQSTIQRIMSKHGVSNPNELLDIQEKLSQSLDQMNFSDEKLAELRATEESLEKHCMDLASKMRKHRKGEAKIIEAKVHETLALLGMSKATFKVDIVSAATLNTRGADEVQPLFNANGSSSLMPLTKVASGGELSRLMLAVKSLVAKHRQLPAIVFDEIDTGISGEVASKMGQILKSLSKDIQIINITHIPQVASKGNHHYFVYKNEAGHGVETLIRRLSHAERVQEIAKMLSGEQVTDAAVKNAEELLAG